MSQSGAKVVTTLGISVGVHTLFMNYQSTLEPLITCPPIGIYLCIHAVLQWDCCFRPYMV